MNEGYYEVFFGVMMRSVVYSDKLLVFDFGVVINKLVVFVGLVLLKYLIM